MSVLVVCKCQVNGAVVVAVVGVPLWSFFFFSGSKAIKNILTIYIFSVSECNNWKIDVSKCIKIRKEEFLHVPIRFQSESFKTIMVSKTCEDFNS